MVDEGLSFVFGDWIFGDGVVRVLFFFDVEVIEGEVVFVGYGIKVFDLGDFGYDFYVIFDVIDKIVLVFCYIFEDVELEYC